MRNFFQNLNNLIILAHFNYNDIYYHLINLNLLKNLLHLNYWKCSLDFLFIINILSIKFCFLLKYFEYN